jgi:hypothetical protein
LVTFLIWNFKLFLLELDQEVGTIHWNLGSTFGFGSDFSNCEIDDLGTLGLNKR